MNPHPHYPQEITEDESDLGFRLLEVEALDESMYRSIPAVAVVRILSPSSILVKTNYGYDHLTFGDTGIPTKYGNGAWLGDGKKIANAAQFLHDYEVGIYKPAVFLIKRAYEFKYSDATASSA